MKLLRYGQPGAEKPGLLDAEGRIRDLSAHTADFAGETVSIKAIDKLRALDAASLPLVEGSPRIGACVAWTPNFHAVGLNYAKHAAESGMQAPAEPVLFSKATTSLSGPNDQVVQPKESTKLDYEVELGIVIGAVAEYVSEADALSYVAGYCVINDVSERIFQIERLGQWVKGKSAPTFGPAGPWLVTADEVGDPQTLGCWLEVNGEKRQKLEHLGYDFRRRRDRQLYVALHATGARRPDRHRNTRRRRARYEAARLAEARRRDAARHRQARRAAPARRRL